MSDETQSMNPIVAEFWEQWVDTEAKRERAQRRTWRAEAAKRNVERDFRRRIVEVFYERLDERGEGLCTLCHPDHVVARVSLDLYLSQTMEYRFVYTGCGRQLRNASRRLSAAEAEQLITNGADDCRRLSPDDFIKIPHGEYSRLGLPHWQLPSIK